MYNMPKESDLKCIEALGKLEIKKRAELVSDAFNAPSIHGLYLELPEINNKNARIFEIFKFNMIDKENLTTITDFQVIEGEVMENRNDFEQLFRIFMKKIVKKLQKDAPKFLFFQSKDYKVMDTLLLENFEDIKIRQIPNLKMGYKIFSFSGVKKIHS